MPSGAVPNLLIFFGIGVVLLGISTTCLLFYGIIRTKTVHTNAKILMSVHCSAMLLISLSSMSVSLTTIFPELNQPSLIVTLLVHEVGFYLISCLSLLIAIEQLLSIYIPCWANSGRSAIFTVIFVSMSLCLSVCISMLIHIYHFYISTNAFGIVLNLLSAMILFIAWKCSSSKYSEELGNATLERRFQMASGFTWTQAILPAAIVGVLVKVFSLIIIWMVIRFSKNPVAFSWLAHGYHIVLDIYVILFSYLVISRHKWLRKATMLTLKTFVLRRKFKVYAETNGTVQHRMEAIKRREDHFSELQRSWNREQP